MPGNPIVSIENLVFSYPHHDPILNIKKTEIDMGEKVFIYGPSGSGKTTLLGLLAGVLQANSGKVSILGHDLSQMSSSKRDAFRGDHLGYVFQMFNLIPYLSVYQNIILPCQLSHVRLQKMGGRSLREGAVELAKGLGIESYLDRKVTHLSVGQQQRVAVARALMGSPEVVIADEPTSALDYDHRELFLKLLFAESKKSGATVLFVSHDRQLEPLFDRCISLKEISHV